VTRAVVPWDRGFNMCAQGTAFAAPPNGYRNQLVVAAKRDPADEVWVNYREVGSTWAPNLPSVKAAPPARAGPAAPVASAPVAAAPLLGLSPQLADASRRTARDSVTLVVGVLLMALAGRLITRALLRRGRRARSSRT
jgi:hypothetical protein